MARIESLSIFKQNGSDKELLKEVYNGVIDNIQSTTISAKLKNQELSGDISSGSVEAKRFVNATVNEYGTARGNGKGTAVKAAPVTVAIDKHIEIIEEVEDADAKMYGVEDLIKRRSNNHGMRIKKTLERAFFECAVNAGTEATLTATTEKGQIDEMIVALQELKNDFVDGVDTMYMDLVCRPSFYTAIQNEIDTVSNPNIDSAAAEIKVYHGVEIDKSTDLPNGVNAVLMVKGSVAQPVSITENGLEKIPLSKAYGFGAFVDYGTKAVSPDLILVAKSAE